MMAMRGVDSNDSSYVAQIDVPFVCREALGLPNEIQILD